jgi:hypothetical protein
MKIHWMQRTDGRSKRAIPTQWRWLSDRTRLLFPGALLADPPFTLFLLNSPCATQTTKKTRWSSARTKRYLVTQENEKEKSGTSSFS